MQFVEQRRKAERRQRKLLYIYIYNFFLNMHAHTQMHIYIYMYTIHTHGMYVSLYANRSANKMNRHETMFEVSVSGRSTLSCCDED